MIISTNVVVVTGWVMAVIYLIARELSIHCIVQADASAMARNVVYCVTVFVCATVTVLTMSVVVVACAFAVTVTPCVTVFVFVGIGMHKQPLEIAAEAKDLSHEGVKCSWPSRSTAASRRAGAGSP